MAFEIARRLIDGVWRTVSIEEGTSGGGSLPAPWTDGGHGDVTVTTDHPTKTALTLIPDGDQAVPILELLDENGDPIVQLGGDVGNGGQQAPLRVIGRGGTAAAQIPFDISNENGSPLFNVDADGIAAHYGQADPNDTSASVLTIGVSPLANEFVGGPLLATAADQSTVTFYVATNGQVYTRKGVILDGNDPIVADDWLAAGQAAIWFDATNGAAKFKIRGRTLDGSYVSGEIALG